MSRRWKRYIWCGFGIACLAAVIADIAAGYRDDEHEAVKAAVAEAKSRGVDVTGVWLQETFDHVIGKTVVVLLKAPDEGPMQSLAINVTVQKPLNLMVWRIVAFDEMRTIYCPIDDSSYR